MNYNITKLEARQFVLLKHGLLGEYLYKTEDDILKFVNSVGCIQYDPVDVCGKNAELVLQSRIKDFKKSMLYSQLYEKRNLIDYFDKNISIFSIQDWPYFERIRERHRNSIRNEKEIEPLFAGIKQTLRETEYVSSKDLDIEGKLSWYWSQTSKARAALEQMYFNGDLVIHHKKGTIRYFSLTERLIDHDILNTPDPNPTEIDYKAWRVLRRIKAVGLLYNKASYAFIYIEDLKTEDRNQVYNKLLNEGKIIQVNVEGIKEPLYIDKNDECYLQDALSGKEFLERMEFIAPLDNLIWDRVLLKSLFDFDYTWEIYFPKEKRKYGYYVLPIIYGTNFIGRIEMVMNRVDKVLSVNNLWLEEGIKFTKKLESTLNQSLNRFKRFNEAKEISFSENYLHYS